MKTYLLNIYTNKKSKKPLLQDLAITDLTNYDEIEKIFINNVYYFDSDKKRIMGTCKKAEVIHEII